MKNDKTLAYYIRGFLTIYLTTRRNSSIHTISSYRDTIKLFLNYVIAVNEIDIAKINFEVLTYENINNFLDYLEENRNITTNTRNQRLACIKSFCKYIISYDPTHLEQLTQIINIKAKKYKYKNIEYFTKEEISELLQRPNLESKQGAKDLVIMVLLYDGALRVSELINLKVEDVFLEPPFKIFIKQAKGNKSREVPVTSDTVEILKKYKGAFNLKTGDYFIKSNQNKTYTSNGIRKIIKKYTKDFRFNVTPHTFRHSKASHLVESGVPLIYIRDLLGHESVETTEIYAKISNITKNKVITDNGIQIDNKIKYNMNEDSNLIEWLSTL